MLIKKSNEQKIKNNKNGKKNVINFPMNAFYFLVIPFVLLCPVRSHFNSTKFSIR